MPTRITVLVDDRAVFPGLAAEHGLALWVEHEGHKLLLDTGASGHALLANAAALRIRVEEAEAIALTHGHFDHTGGLGVLAPRMGGIDVYAHPDVFVAKYARSPSGWHARGTALSQSQLEAAGIFARLSRDAQEVVPGVFLTGEVPRDPRFVPSTPHLCADSPMGRIIDPFHDDQALVLRARDGLVVISGCAHSGVINLCRAAQEWMNPRHLVGQSHLRAVLGGFHLGDASPQLVAATIEGFRELLPTAIHPLHCTGEPATRALVQALPDRCHPIGAGSVLEF